MQLLLSALLAFGSAAAGSAAPAAKKAVPPGLAKKGGVPPGLAKKGGVPPGLARKFGRQLPERPYIAFDPSRTDRAWFLIGGEWRLKTGFSAGLRLEVKDSLKLPVAPPPIPLPKVPGDLHVVLFE